MRQTTGKIVTYSLIIDGDLVELMFQAIDRLVSLVDVLKEPDTEPVPESVVDFFQHLEDEADSQWKRRFASLRCWVPVSA